MGIVLSFGIALEKIKQGQIGEFGKDNTFYYVTLILGAILARAFRWMGFCGVCRADLHAQNHFVEFLQTAVTVWFVSYSSNKMHNSFVMLYSQK